MSYPRVWDHNRKKLKDAAEREGFDALILLGKGNSVYATGVREPSGAVVLSDECGDHVLVPLLDYHRVMSQAPRDFQVKAFYRGGEEPIRAGIGGKDLLTGGLTEAVVEVLKGCSRKPGVDLGWAPYTAGRELESRLEAGDATSLISRVRSVKSSDEIGLIEEAQRKAEEALRKAVNELGEGVSEGWLAGLISQAIKSLGAWSEAFATIVAFYDNTALPHHTPTTLRLTRPGPVLIDLGAVEQGYHSDMTRTLWWGSGGSSFRELVEAVVEAQGEAEDLVAPGVELSDVDRAARVVLEKRGLSRYFIHGLGHGVGVEIHEEPYIRPGARGVLEKGMVITIEPGVYIAGLHGARIENLVVVTSRGRRVLTRIDKVI